MRHSRSFSVLAAIAAAGMACQPLPAAAQVATQTPVATATSAPATSAPAANAGTSDSDQLATLKQQIDDLKAQAAVHERELLTLEARLEALEGAPTTPLHAAGAQTAAVIPSANGVVTQRHSNSVDATYLQQNALFRRGLTITPSFSESYASSRFFTLNGFLALGAVFLGNADVSQQRSSQSAFNLNAAYGLNNRTQVAVNVPYLHRTTTYSTVGAGYAANQASEATVDVGGVGDISGGVYYQIAREHGNSPNVVANFQVSAPTGRAPFGIKNTQAPSNTNLIYPGTLPTGQGVWGVSTGATIIKTVDPVVLYGGANLYYYFPGKFGDISPDATTVTPGYAQPGKAFEMHFGTGFALNDKMSLTLGYQQIMSADARLRAVGGPWQKVVGTGLRAGMLLIGTSYATDAHHSWSSQLGVGVTPDAPNVQLDFQLPQSY